MLLKHKQIYYISNNLSRAELNFTVIKKEFLAVIYAINLFNSTLKNTLFLYTQIILLFGIS